MSNNNVFYATNPAKLSEALWKIITDSAVDVSEALVFLPSRRAVRSVEKMIAKKMGGVAVLPTLVALGEGVDDEIPDNYEINDCAQVITKAERVAVLSRLLAADANVGNLITALPIANDLVRMQDYLENEGVNPKEIDWMGLVDEKYASHFQNKAKILTILSDFTEKYAQGRLTNCQIRNRDIRNWVNYLDNYKLVVACGSTGSVPATADLIVEIAQKKHGRVLLSGKISGRIQDFELNTNPYNAEYKLLKRIGLKPEDLIGIDVGDSVIDFMNYAFGNGCAENLNLNRNLKNCNLVVAPRESIEAKLVVNIAKKALEEKKTVLVITPDAAGNQRIAEELRVAEIEADFSSGISGAMTDAGRAILNLMDKWIEAKTNLFDDLYFESNQNLFDTIAKMFERYQNELMPFVEIDACDSVQVWCAIKEISDALERAQIVLNLSEARAFVEDCLSGVVVRPGLNDCAQVVVLGTIESRMQTADVVILTGLNDGMFPAQGYENGWLPKSVAEKIGLPAPDHKVSLQALDFMNLSCGAEVYWLRTAVAGGVQTIESRFISRVVVRKAEFGIRNDLLDEVYKCDDVPEKRLDYSSPQPPADWSDVYVTELELLIHNPYAFYVRHILRLSVKDDYWLLPDARDFGNLIHSVVEKTTQFSVPKLIQQMDMRAREILGGDSVIFHFWHKRFVDIAPVLVDVFGNRKDDFAEINGSMKIAGRNVRARADRVWDGGVLDIKTGMAPSKKQLLDGNMPQLPLEAMILKTGGFKIPITKKSDVPVIQFLQLKNNDVRLIEYDSDISANMMQAALEKTQELFNIYSAGNGAYDYLETGNQKYKIYDDFARNKD